MGQTKRVSIPTLFKLWHGGTNNKEICSKLSISPAYLRKLVKQYKLPRRERGDYGKSRIIDPTPEELEQRMAETRAGWTEREADSRYCGPRREAWQPPAYTYNAGTGNFSRN